MSTIPTITLKNVKVAEFASEETYCYEATVYVDGKRYCKASNDGHGGPDHYFNFAKGAEDIDAIGKRLDPTSVATYDETAKANEGKKWEDYEKGEYVQTHYSAFEEAVGEALTAALYLKDLKRHLSNRKKILFVRDNQIWECKFRQIPTPERREREIVRIREEEPGTVVLTGMEPEEALPLYRQAAA